MRELHCPLLLQHGVILELRAVMERRQAEIDELQTRYAATISSDTFLNDVLLRLFPTTSCRAPGFATLLILRKVFPKLCVEADLRASPVVHSDRAGHAGLLCV